MGRMLAALHRKTSDRYAGQRQLDRLAPQKNGGAATGSSSDRRRLQPQLRRAEQNGFPFEEMDYSRILERHEPQPSLLHGDLWSGNAGFTAEGR